MPGYQPSYELVCLLVSQHICEPEYLWELSAYLWASIPVSPSAYLWACLPNCEPAFLWACRPTCEPTYLWASIPVSQHTCEPSAYLLVIWFPADEELIFMHDFFLSSAILTLFIVLSSYSTTLTSLLTKVTQLTNACPQMTSLGRNEVRTYSSTSTY